ncbi:MAG: hypothetical protein RL701_7046 [Pseudomonadota bacterium]|jgi:hypothetical protein
MSGVNGHRTMGARKREVLTSGALLERRNGPAGIKLGYLVFTPRRADRRITAQPDTASPG